MLDRTFSGADLARRQRGLTLRGGGGGLRKKNPEKIWIPTGDLQPP